MTYRNVMLCLAGIVGLVVLFMVTVSFFIGDMFFASDEWQNPQYLCVDDGGVWIEKEQRCDCGTGRHNTGYYCTDD